jgi:phospholipase/carboxylesterase
MQDEFMAHSRKIENWVIRERKPVRGENLPVILMLHGWTGDENSMWVFASRLPAGAYLIAPRGIYETPLGGYGWEQTAQASKANLDDFQLSVEQLRELLINRNFPGADFNRLHLLGFSQGAALAFSYALVHTAGVRSILSLSGFIPAGAEDYVAKNTLNGIPVFLAHGTQDEMVPIQNAWVAASILERAGAYVTACEDDVGHKLSASCFKGLEAFLDSYIGL